MNLDELISKYLDGELNNTEDAFLRSKLSEDAVARLKFDSAVNLHIAFKEDAESIFPPLDLVEKTEDLILMRIFAHAPETHRRRVFLWDSVPMMAAIIVFFMFTFVFEISIPTINDTNDLSLNDSKLSSNLNENTIDKSKKFTVTTKNNAEINGVRSSNGNLNEIDLIAKSKINSEMNLTTKDETELQKVKTDDNLIPTENQLSETLVDRISSTKPVVPADLPLNYDNHSSNEETITSPEENTTLLDDNDGLKMKNNGLSLKTEFNNQTLSVNNSQSEMNGFSNKSDKVLSLSDVSGINGHRIIQLGSIFGTDVYRGGIQAEDEVISHFSQSIAYAFDDDERFGVELGYTQYSYNEQAVIHVNKNHGTKVSSGGIEAFEGGFDIPTTRSTAISIANTKQILWASAFYEYSFIQTHDFALAGRLGAGGSNDGFIGYGRLFIQYELFSLLQLTLGVDSRVFNAETSRFTLKDDKIKTTASLVYGLQFKF